MDSATAGFSLEQFLAALESITGTGSFHSTGSRKFFLPEITLPDGEELAFPLSATQAVTVKKHCEPAPYGKGEETILDESVRRCWQMDAGKLTWSPAWKKEVQKIVKTVQKDLGIEGKVIAEPYKLLLYEKGGHFKRHRDTEKLGAMFGSLIIALPSAHEGGTLTISHEGKDISVDFATGEHWRDFQFAAFFADCEHEVLPVTSGHRLCLVYNLALQSDSEIQLNSSIMAQATTLLPHLETLYKEQNDELCAILLTHQYTENNLSLRGLKNHDNARGHALMSAAREAGFIPHLALVTLYQMGELDEDWQYGRSRYDDISNDATMGEVYEESLSISHWRDAEDQPAPLTEFRILKSDLISAEEIGSGNPKEKEAEGYTGNAGCTMEYWYRHAAIILWPREAHESILTRYDLRGSCLLLLQQSLQKKLTKKSSFHRLAHATIHTLADGIRSSDNTYQQQQIAEPGLSLIDALLNARIEELDQACTDTLLPIILPFVDSHRLSLLVQRFGADILKHLPEDSPPEIQITLLAALLTLPTILEKQTAALAGKLPELFKQTTAQIINNWKFQKKSISYSSQLHIALAASFLITDKATRQQLSDLICEDDDLDHLRTDLAEALRLQDHAQHLSHPNSLFSTISQRALTTLKAEIERPLEPYPNWSRPVPKPNRFNHLDPVLSDFLTNPDAQEHRIKAVQATRKILENQIQSLKLDLKFHTERNGSPHTLVCIKTDASYKRALEQRTKDEALLKELQKLAK